MLKQIKKIIPYLLILIALVGFFGYGNKVIASHCHTEQGTLICNPDNGGAHNPDGTPQINTQSTTGVLLPKTTPGENTLEQNLKKCSNFVQGDFDGCLQKLAYVIFFSLPAFLLSLSAQVFNALTSMALSSKFYTDSSSFVNAAWIIVRDISNIFFIIVLIYIGIKTILGMGGSETKSMVANVIIFAILINFSMFFTKVVIDSSNVLALIFYNKISVQVKNQNGEAKDRFYIPLLNSAVTGIEEKDLSGSMVGAFNPTSLLTQEFFEEYKKEVQAVGSLPGLVGYIAAGAGIGALTPLAPVTATAGAIAGATVYTVKTIIGYFIPVAEVPTPVILGIIFISGAIMLTAAYSFIVAGLSFLGRMIELWLLIIFSPFAFMSFSVPKLKNIEYLGGEKWLERLITTAFMAPIFMFLLYIIFLFINANMFASVGNNQGPFERIFITFLPGVVIIILLLKATSFAKKGSGVIGEAVINGTKVLAGLAIGGAALGTAGALRGTVGKFIKGASTGDIAANRIQDNQNRVHQNQQILNTAGSDWLQKMKAKSEIRKANKEIRLGNWQQSSGFADISKRVGGVINRDQHDVVHASHSRHDLDTAAGEVTHGDKKKYDELTHEERFEARRKIARDRVVRDNAGDETKLGTPPPVLGLAQRFGNRKWDALTQVERDAVDAAMGAVNNQLTPGSFAETHTGKIVNDARVKQGLISNVIQSSATGTYDIRGLAKVVAKEQSSGVAKAAMALTGAVALGMRGALKQAGANHGEPQGRFFQDIANTVSDALKSAKLNVDLSHIGEEKKEGSHGGGGGHH